MCFRYLSSSMERWWQLLNDHAWKDRCHKGTWGQSPDDILYGNRGAPVFHGMLPGISQGGECSFQVLLWEFPTLFWLNIWLSVVKSLPAGIFFLPLCASVGILTWRNCHPLSSEPSPIPLVWQFEIIYHVRNSEPLGNLQHKINCLEECLNSNDMCRFEWNIVFMIPTIYYSLCSFLLNKPFHDQG